VLRSNVRSTEPSTGETPPMTMPIILDAPPPSLRGEHKRATFPLHARSVLLLRFLGAHITYRCAVCLGRLCPSVVGFCVNARHLHHSIRHWTA